MINTTALEPYTSDTSSDFWFEHSSDIKYAPGDIYISPDTNAPRPPSAWGATSMDAEPLTFIANTWSNMRDKVTIIPNFITPDECDILNRWTKKAVDLKWLDFGITNNQVVYQSRLTTRMYGHRFDKYPDLAYTIRDQIRAALNIFDLPISTNGGGREGIVVSSTLPGGDVYQHVDGKEGDLELLRCNIISQAAESGAELTVADKFYDVQCGDLHCYLASKHLHKVSMVSGSRPRTLWMFGFQINESDWENNAKRRYYISK